MDSRFTLKKLKAVVHVATSEPRLPFLRRMASVAIWMYEHKAAAGTNGGTAAADIVAPKKAAPKAAPEKAAKVVSADPDNPKIAPKHFTDDDDDDDDDRPGSISGCSAAERVNRKT